MIFTISHIEQIIQKEKKLQNSFDKEKYITDSFTIVNKDLIKYFDKDYLLHKVYFIEDENTLKSLVFKDIEEKQNADTKRYIDIAETKIKGSKTIPFTKIILNKHLPGLVLYKGKRPKKIGETLIQNLETANCVNQLAENLGVKLNNIRDLVNIYQIHSKVYPSDFYAYFIRPFALHKLYNGIFLILIRRPLQDYEFLEIGSLWTKILSETALHKIENTIRSEEQEFIFEAQTHTLNSEISSITQYLEVAISRLEVNQEDIVYQNIECAFNNTKRLRNINAFNLFQMKTRGLNSKIEIAKYTSHITDQNLFNEIKVTPVSIKTAILNTIKILTGLIHSLKYVDDVSATIKLLILSKLKEQVQNLPDYKVNTVLIGLEIILLDLIKNAVVHSNTKNPQVRIEFQDDNHYIVVCIINNTTLPTNVYNYINTKDPQSSNCLKNKKGIQTVKRIINNNLLNDSKYRWMIRANKTSITSETNIMLYIPKNDVNEKE